MQMEVLLKNKTNVNFWFLVKNIQQPLSLLYGIQLDGLQLVFAYLAVFGNNKIIDKSEWTIIVKWPHLKNNNNKFGCIHKYYSRT